MINTSPGGQNILLGAQPILVEILVGIGMFTGGLQTEYGPISES